MMYEEMVCGWNPCNRNGCSTSYSIIVLKILQIGSMCVHLVVSLLAILLLGHFELPRKVPLNIFPLAMLLYAACFYFFYMLLEIRIFLRKSSQRDQ